MSQEMREEDRERGSALIELACRLGASKAGIIRAADISVEDDLAKLCRQPQCENYGQAASCPPHVSGPSGFREWVRRYELALVFKMDVPSESLFSNERQGIFRLLHEIASGIEHSAVQRGYAHSKAFAGGSCKRIFCEDQAHCRVLSREGACRHADCARPSMSGFGINVSKLMSAAGWTLKRATAETEAGKISMGTVCGLVLLG